MRAATRMLTLLWAIVPLACRGSADTGQPRHELLLTEAALVPGEGPVTGPVLSYLSTGEGVMAWIETVGTEQAVRYLRLDSAGDPVGQSVTANAAEQADCREPNVLILSNGRVAIAWSQMSSWPRRQARYSFFDVDDAPLVLDATVFETQNHGQVQPQLVRSLGGEAFTLVWLDSDSADELGLIRRVRLGADGLPMGSMGNLFPATNLSMRPVAHSNDQGLAVVCWVGPLGTTSFGLFGEATALTTEVQEDIYSQHAEIRATCDLDESGNFVVAQIIKEPDQPAWLRIREYDSHGGFLADVSPAGTLDDAVLRQIDVALLPDGAAWTLTMLADDPGDALLVLASDDERRWHCPVKGASTIREVSLSRNAERFVAGLQVLEGGALSLGTAILTPEAW